MKQYQDGVVLSLFEQIQDLPDDEHDAFLDRQDLPAILIARVRRLIKAERYTQGFLDTVVVMPSGRSEDVAFPDVGDRLGNYELLRPLAAGGMGVVFLARRADDVYEQDVAIKLIRAVHLLGDPKARAALIARFEAERVILAQLQHPNIARILDGGSTSTGVPYLVMEHVDGVPLTDYCSDHRLDVAARLRLLCKVCDAVQEAHRNLIVHRDIKPDNILVTPAGEPRLIDFGIACELAPNADPTGNNATLFAAMTPAYASPEQVRHQPLTTSSDVYSLGIVLFQLIAGQRPYELAGLTPAAIERVVCDVHPPPLRQVLQTIPMNPDERRRWLQQVGTDLERIVSKALHKDPARRYHSAEALAEELRRYLDGRPVLAHPDSTWYRSMKFVRRNWRGVSLTSLALLAILASTAIAWHQAGSAHRAMADTRRANNFLVDVLNLSDPYSTGGELTLRAAMERAYQLVDDQFSDRPELGTDLRLTLSESLLRSGHVEKAGAQLERALKDSEALFGSDAPRTVQALVSLAAARREQGRYSDSERLYQQALIRIERSAWRDDALQARALSDLGLLHLVKEEYAAAAHQLQLAVDLDARAVVPIPEHVRAQTLTNLAQARSGQGELDEAERLYILAQASFEAEHPEGSPQIAIVLNSRANIARRRDQPEQALQLQKQALEMHRKSFAGDHVMVLVPSINLTRQYVDLGRPQEALPYAVAADAMARRLYPGAHNYRIQAVTALADTQRALGLLHEANDALREAEIMLSQADTPPRLVEYVETVRSDLCAVAPTLEGCESP